MRCTNVATLTKETIMTTQLVSLDQVREQRSQKSDQPRRIRTIKSFRDLYSFLVSTIKEVEPKKAYNAGLVKFVLEHIDEIPYWEDFDCQDNLFDMMSGIQIAETEYQDCGEEP